MIMAQYINKSALVAEIERQVKLSETCQKISGGNEFYRGAIDEAKEILSFLDTLEVKDPYEQCVQYDSIKSGIQAHAETYSFNIESKLFNQLTKEQQELWREEIEQACISGGEVGVELARDPRYKENLEVKDEVISTDTTSPNSLKISRYGNSHIEAMKEALRMEYEKGRADVLRCIDPDEMVADFCSQPISMTRSLASIYRQGIIDIIKRINRNEETSITGTRSIDDGGVS